MISRISSILFFHIFQKQTKELIRDLVENYNTSSRNKQSKQQLIETRKLEKH